MLSVTSGTLWREQSQGQARGTATNGPAVTRVGQVARLATHGSHHEDSVIVDRAVGRFLSSCRQYPTVCCSVIARPLAPDRPILSKRKAQANRDSAPKSVGRSWPAAGERAMGGCPGLKGGPVVTLNRASGDGHVPECGKARRGARAALRRDALCWLGTADHARLGDTPRQRQVKRVSGAFGEQLPTAPVTGATPLAPPRALVRFPPSARALAPAVEPPRPVAHRSRRPARLYPPAR